MKYFIGIIAGLLVIGAGLFAFNTQKDSPSAADSIIQSEDALTIATSFYPLEFLAQGIVGDKATVVNVGSGKDPHDFQPSTKNIQSLVDADLVALQGADLEPWGDRVLQRLTDSNVPVFIATENVTLREFTDKHEGHDDEEHEGEEHHEDEHHEEDGHDEHGHEEDHDDHEDERGDHKEDKHNDEREGHDHGAFDPHTWLDPVMFIEVAQNFADTISKIDPVNASTYKDNTQALVEKLQALHAMHVEKLGSCELDEVITSHDAFSYFAARYDIEIHSIAGISTQDTPSVTTLAELKEEAEEGVKAILLEENSVVAFGETLAKETGLETLPVNPIAFTSSNEKNYFSLMTSNLNSFATALNCN